MISTQSRNNEVLNHMYNISLCVYIYRVKFYKISLCRLLIKFKGHKAQFWVTETIWDLRIKILEKDLFDTGYRI